VGIGMEAVRWGRTAVVDCRPRGLLAGVCAAALCSGAPALGEEPTKEVVIVTGERVERTLGETAASVFVQTGADIDALAAPDRVEQLLALTPNVQLGAGDQGPAIRGQESTGVLQGADAFLGGTRPRATLQVDGRALGYNEFIYGLASVWDVARVEVFRGPQTTTQGRNSIAGAIFVKTEDPTFRPEAKARAIAGNYDTFQGSAAVSGPLLGDQVAGRLAVDVRRHDSWVNYSGPDGIEGADRSADDYEVYRGKLLVRPDAAPSLDVLLTFTHVESENPQGEAIQAPFERRGYFQPGGGYWKTDVDSLVADIGYTFSDAFKLDVIAAYGDSRIDRLSTPGGGVGGVDLTDISLETILSYQPEDGPVTGLVGVYALQAQQDEAIDLSAFLGFGDFRDEQTSLGVFGEATWEALPNLYLTGGVRWQEDRQDRLGSLGLCNPDVFCFRVDYERTFSDVLPKAAVAYDISPDVRIGASAQKGFNPGGTTISFETGQQDQFEEETLWSYEAFVRSSHLDGRLRLNANAFFTDFTDAQRPQTRAVTRPDGSIALDTDVSNAPKAESYGLEAQASYQVFDNLDLGAGLGLLETEITETIDPVDPVRGKDFQRAPNVSGFLSLGWTIVPNVRLDVQARRFEDYFSDDANTPALAIDGATVIDAQASWTIGAARLFAFIRNAGDEFYMTQLYSPTFGTAGDPEEYGVGLEARF
jgi:iron complex outermembrane recepter protein